MKNGEIDQVYYQRWILLRVGDHKTSETTRDCIGASHSCMHSQDGNTTFLILFVRMKQISIFKIMWPWVLVWGSWDMEYFIKVENLLPSPLNIVLVKYKTTLKNGENQSCLLLISWGFYLLLSLVRGPIYKSNITTVL